MAPLIFTKENKVKVVGMTVAFFALMAVGNIVFFVVASVGNVKFLAYNRIDSVYVAEFFKVEGTEHVSVVGEGKGRHVKSLCFCNKLIEGGTRVQKRIV